MSHWVHAKLFSNTKQSFPLYLFWMRNRYYLNTFTLKTTDTQCLVNAEHVWNALTLINKRKKREDNPLEKRRREKELHVCLVYYVNTRCYVYQQTFFFLDFPPQPPPPWKFFGSAPESLKSHMNYDIWLILLDSRHSHIEDHAAHTSYKSRSTLLVCTVTQIISYM